MRILALDYGGKRTGIAVTDPLQIIATPLDTIPTENVIDFLTQYFIQEQVKEIIIGMPVNFKGGDTHSTESVREFILKFTIAFPDKKIISYDERLTSKLAFNAMISGGMKKKQRSNKETIDKLSATIILQDYLKTIQ